MKFKFVWLFAFLCTVAVHSVESPPVRNNTPNAHLKPATQSRPPKKQIVQEKGNNEYFKPLPTYYIGNIGRRGSLITTRDKTVWAVAPRSARTAMLWAQQDPFTITLNKNHSSYKYCLVNQVTKKHVEAKLSPSPKANSSTFIDYIYVSPSHGFIRLTDGTRWRTDPSSCLCSWQRGQAVLVGENLAGLGRRNILININENNHVETTQQPFERFVLEMGEDQY